MAKLSYIARILRGASLKRLNNNIDLVRERCDRSRLNILLDMANCTIRYGAGYYDYFVYDMYDMTPAQRATVLTRVKTKKVYDYLNDPQYDALFDNKSMFNRRFEEFLRREYIVVSEMDEAAFERFMADKDIVFAKPDSSEGGKGIERLVKADFASLEEMYRYVKDPAKGFGLVEEAIVQHEAMKAIYPLAVNTLRIATVVGDDGKTVYCAYVICKMGGGGAYVDNANEQTGGLFAPVDMETGEVYCEAVDVWYNAAAKHPYSGIDIVGYRIPYVKEAIELAKRAALVVPQVRFVGWDVCIMPDGPAIIEGNNYPGYFFLPRHTEDHTGLVPFFSRFVPGL